jgi:cysteine desulfurase
LSFLDYNAGWPLWPEVVELLARAHAEPLANPASLHQRGQAARARLEAAREKVADLLGCARGDVLFTSSGSEANALALKGTFLARSNPSKRGIVSSRMEHPSVLFALEQLKRHGAELTLLAPSPEGYHPAGQLNEALTEDIALCSLAFANNETGALQPVGELARTCNRRGIGFHCDAVQAAGLLPVRLGEIPADLLSLSGHKLGGPVGVGVLVARRGQPLEALVPGHQEGGRRGGTADVVGAEAFALALAICRQRQEKEAPRLAGLRDLLETEVQRRLPGVQVNGVGPRLPNTSNLAFEGVDGQALLIALDLKGLQVSHGAACASGSPKPSHVLTAMGQSDDAARSALRFSLGFLTTTADVEATVQALVEAVLQARRTLS